MVFGSFRLHVCATVGLLLPTYSIHTSKTWSSLNNSLTLSSFWPFNTKCLAVPKCSTARKIVYIWQGHLWFRFWLMNLSADFHIFSYGPSSPSNFNHIFSLYPPSVCSLTSLYKLPWWEGFCIKYFSLLLSIWGLMNLSWLGYSVKGSHFLCLKGG